DSAVRLLREMAGFEADLLVPNLDGDLRPALGRDTHQLSSTLLVEGGSSSQPVGWSRWARSNFHPPCSWELAAQAELLDEGAVALEVVLLQVVQKAAAPPDELEQPAPRVMVVLMDAQMLGQLVDPLRQHRDLHLRRAG